MSITDRRFNEVLPLLKREYPGVDISGVINGFKSSRWRAFRASLAGYPEATRIFEPQVRELRAALRQAQGYGSLPVAQPKKPSLFCCCSDSAAD